MAGSIRLSARTKAPSSRVSSNMVAVWVCSVLFMSCQDFRASGRRRLSTVSTMACIKPDKQTWKQRYLSDWEKKKKKNNYNDKLFVSIQKAGTCTRLNEKLRWSVTSGRIKIKTNIYFLKCVRDGNIKSQTFTKSQRHNFGKTALTMKEELLREMNRHITNGEDSVSFSRTLRQGKHFGSQCIEPFRSVW